MPEETPNDTGNKQTLVPEGLSGYTQSENIASLVEALAQAEAEFDTISKNASNPFFTRKNDQGKDTPSRYADLAELIRATRPSLSKYKLLVVQAPGLVGRFAAMTTTIYHATGQWISFVSGAPAFTTDSRGTKFDVQTIGKADTYLRRYAYQSALNLSAEEDDDGNDLAGNESKPPREGPRVNHEPAQSSSAPRPNTSSKPLESRGSVQQPGPDDPITDADLPENMQPDPLVDVPTKDDKKGYADRLRAFGVKDDAGKEALKNAVVRLAKGEDTQSLTKTQWTTALVQLEAAFKEDPEKFKAFIKGE